MLKPVPVIGGAIALAIVSLVYIGQTDPGVQTRVREKAAIEACWKDQSRKSLTPEEARFIAGACEAAEEKFRKTHVREP